MFVCLSVCLLVCLSACLLVCLSACLFVCLRQSTTDSRNKFHNCSYCFLLISLVQRYLRVVVHRIECHTTCGKSSQNISAFNLCQNENYFIHYRHGRDRCFMCFNDVQKILQLQWTFRAICCTFRAISCTFRAICCTFRAICCTFRAICCTFNANCSTFIHL